ncbi:MAG: universal stress protein [Bryobacterales bacterium]|nr:universal stress protein [Bryobacterales bacterium]
MKVLVCIDGSPSSEAVVQEIIRRPWPPGTEVKLLFVVHAFPFFPDHIFFAAAAHEESLREAKENGAKILETAAALIQEQSPNLRVTTELLEGSPKKTIVDEAERWRAGLVVLGSHGHGPARRFLLGSVAQAVTLHAPCSVEVVRTPHVAAA